MKYFYGPPAARVFKHQVKTSITNQFLIGDFIARNYLLERSLLSVLLSLVYD